ncbi:MAG: hypothetical protein M1431_04150 [Candidatus Thermoplasmatota archaeon]|nr:hypothetical protein [Candidatus Thermoplasmatota archaeon]
MAVEKRKHLGVEAGLDRIGFDYSANLIQEVVAVAVGEMKILNHPDGKGFSIVTRIDIRTFTIITKRYVKDGIIKHGFKVLSEVTEYKDDGVYLNGRKL